MLDGPYANIEVRPGRHQNGAEHMQCTATKREPAHLGGKDRRCERQLGHAGLHRYYLSAPAKVRAMVQEFSNAEAWFPHHIYNEEGNVE